MGDGAFREGENSHRITLGPFQYIKAVEAQGDGPPRFHISENLWSRSNTRLTLTKASGTG